VQGDGVGLVSVMHNLTISGGQARIYLSKPGGSCVHHHHLNRTTHNCIMTAYCPAVRVPGLDNRYARISGVVGV
jgi:hypothetical protein